MAAPQLSQLSRREREIMHALYALGEAAAADIAHHLDDEEGYDSIRVTVGILAKKGFVKHRRDGKRYVYRPKISADRARRLAMDELTQTFFKGCPTSAILAFLEAAGAHMTEDDLEEVSAFVERTVRMRA
jgi:BlaI family transcriptional regulator, penicillinase repressor